MLQKIALILILITHTLTAQAFEGCRQIFIKSETTEFSLRLSHEVAGQAEKTLNQAGMIGVKARGYAILIGAIVGASAVSSFITSRVAPDLSFAVGLIVGAGIYALRGPITEPWTSKLRQLAYTTVDFAKSSPAVKYLEDMWFVLQQKMSMNAQMSRNNITQFINSIQQNFYEAYRAVNSSNPEYAADQVALAAYRIRSHFSEIPANDPSVKAVINATFTNHVVIDQAFIDLVWVKLKKADAEWEKSQLYYEEVFHVWFTRSLE